MLSSIAGYRDRATNRLESRIGRYADVPMDVKDLQITDKKIENISSKLCEFRNVISASGRYHRLRAQIEKETDPTRKEEAERERDAAHREIVGTMNDLNLTVGAAVGSELVHNFTTGEMDEQAEEYEKRLELYDMLIGVRNNIVGSGASPEQMKEKFISIYQTLITMTRDYDKEPDEISSELLDRVNKTVAFKREMKDITKGALGGTEVEIMLRMPGDNSPLKAAIYPRDAIIEKLKKALAGGRLEVVMVNPMSFIKDRTDINPEYGSATINVDYNNVRDMEENIIFQIEAKRKEIDEIKSLKMAHVIKARLNDEIKKLEAERERLVGGEIHLTKDDDFSIKDSMSIVRDQEIDFEEHEKLVKYLNTKGKVPVVISFE